jgi:hypothetical protein
MRKRSDVSGNSNVIIAMGNAEMECRDGKTAGFNNEGCRHFHGRSSSSRTLMFSLDLAANPHSAGNGRSADLPTCAYSTSFKRFSYSCRNSSIVGGDGGGQPFAFLAKRGVAIDFSS